MSYEDAPSSRLPRHGSRYNDNLQCMIDCTKGVTDPVVPILRLSKTSTYKIRV